MTIRIGNQGAGFFYTHTEEFSHLPPGVYETTSTEIGGELVPSFKKIIPNNDKPIEIADTMTGLMREIGHFFSIPEKYQRFGFPHKRGYLLHGAPGTGKSCLLRLLEESFVRQFGGVALIWRGGDIRRWYQSIRENEKNRPIMVVCEDIDGVLAGFEEEILEFLDGQVALNNFVIVATTNHLDSIPARIKDRPSRIDRLVEIGFPDRESQRKYLAALGLEIAEIEVILDAVATKAPDGLSMASLKEVVIGSYCLGYSAEEVVSRLANPEVNSSFVRRDPKQSLHSLFSGWDRSE